MDKSLVNFVDISLRGVGQVIFQNNPLTGLFFLAAIFWGAVSTGQITIATGAVVALLVATITAMLLHADSRLLKQGMFGFNGVLVGAAVPTFLAPSPAMWFVLIIGAAVSSVAMLAISKVMKTWDTPALTFPFVLTSWFLALSAYSFEHLPITSMGPRALPHDIGADPAGFSASILPLTSAWLKGPAEVFLINNAVSGVLVITGLLVSSVWAGIFALLGSAVALFLSLGLGASLSDIEAGLFGFSPVLTAVGLGCVFFQPSWRVTLFALLGTVFTVLVQGALQVALTPVGIPTFTAPFVFVTWLFLLAKADLSPPLNAPVKEGVLD